jgi:translocator protein
LGLANIESNQLMSVTQVNRQTMRASTAALLAIGVVATAAVIGGSYGPQNPRTGLWYAKLRKPPFTPPGPVFAVAWSILEILLCVTGYRLLRSRPGTARTVALTSWPGNVAGLAGFPVVFFGRKMLGPSASVTSAMFASASATAASSVYADPVAALAGTPLVAWTAFATLLSEEIWRRN